MSLCTDFQKWIYKKVQHIDEEAINRFKDEWYNYAVRFTWKKLSIKEIFNFVPAYDLFLNKELYSSIHWIRHTLRVLVATTIITDTLALPKVQRDSLMLAASLHDICRIDDNEDFEHSKRAANRFIQNKHLFVDKLKIDVDLVYNIILFHNSRSNDDIDCSREYLYMIGLFKSADAIDRYRFPKKKWRPSFDRLIFPFPEEFVKIHKSLVHRSEIYYQRENDWVNSVFSALKDLDFF